MTNRTASTRYARALLEVALRENADLLQIDADLREFSAVVTEHATLAKVLMNPAVPVTRKHGAMVELIAAARMHPMLGKLLLLLTDRDRLVLLPDLAATFHERLLAHQNVVQAEVTTAVALAPERARQIEKSLAQATGRTVTVSTRVDPSILGGLVARVGSTVYDGSVTSHLQRLKQRLEENV